MCLSVCVLVFVCVYVAVNSYACCLRIVCVRMCIYVSECVFACVAVNSRTCCRWFVNDITDCNSCFLFQCVLLYFGLVCVGWSVSVYVCVFTWLHCNKIFE